ncbi:velvet factor-domain-containing protein [Auriculariales sp. MPI-PUGE-AT-0066]|nr:velvet factor-domain-containing protein [Auriculariales sp. MPI-PUGE-AT-0066]
MEERNVHDYKLTILQEPKQARMCGIGGKADRRPIDPPPIVQLEMNDDGSGEQAQSYHQNPYYVMLATLTPPDRDEELHHLKDGKTVTTTGSTVSSLYHMKVNSQDHPDAALFVFPDLSVRTEGTYRLKFTLFEIVGDQMMYCKHIYSKSFYVYSAKKFPGMEESTPLSISLAEQGIKIRIRKDVRGRRQAQPIQYLGPIEDPDDNELDTASGQPRKRKAISQIQLDWEASEAKRRRVEAGEPATPSDSSAPPAPQPQSAPLAAPIPSANPTSADMPRPLIPPQVPPVPAPYAQNYAAPYSAPSSSQQSNPPISQHHPPATNASAQNNIPPMPPHPPNHYAPPAPPPSSHSHPYGPPPPQHWPDPYAHGAYPSHYAHAQRPPMPPPHGPHTPGAPSYPPHPGMPPHPYPQYGMYPYGPGYGYMPPPPPHGAPAPSNSTTPPTAATNAAASANGNANEAQHQPAYPRYPPPAQGYPPPPHAAGYAAPYGQPYDPYYWPNPAFMAHPPPHGWYGVHRPASPAAGGTSPPGPSRESDTADNNGRDAASHTDNKGAD